MRSALEKILLVKLSLKSPPEGQKLWRRDGSSNSSVHRFRFEKGSPDLIHRYCSSKQVAQTIY